ncbi:MAG: hypothetical protein HOQ24_14920, partial [Mycobacteriaceae bacterium]|nr:hypothetical protein [Mycobacteriaceae bacterium]
MSRLPGRWALIFDNASEPGLPGRWIPAAGDGDILITSLNAAANYGRATVIEVGTMTEAEALHLLRKRLPGSWSAIDASALTPPLEVCEHWPLAIELIAGYVTTCAIGLEGIDSVVHEIRRRAINDHASLPPGYPRTLTAAIHMCLEPLIERWQAAPDDPDAAMPIAFVTALAYLGSRRIPIQLIGSSLMLDHEQTLLSTPPDGATYLAPPAFELVEAIRAIRRYSLIGPDEPIAPERDRTTASYVQTVQVNSIVQEVVRAHHEYLPRRHAVMMFLAAHTNCWLMAASHFGQWQRVRLLLAHARTLFSHVAAAQVVEPATIMLATNVALMQRSSGDFETAEDIWRNLIDIYGSDPVPEQENVYVQVLANLACLRLDRPDRSRATEEELKGWLERILQFAHVHAIAAPEATAHVIAPVVAALQVNAANAEVRVSAAVDPLRLVFNDLASRLPHTPMSRDAQRLLHLETTFADDDFDLDAGIRTCRTIITNGDIGGLNELGARKLLIEMLLSQPDWASASVELRHFKTAAETSQLNIGALNDLIHNAGFRCAMHVCLGIREDFAHAAAILHDLIAWPLAPIAAQQASIQDQHRFRLLQAVDHLVSGQADAAERLLLTVVPDDFSDTDNLSTPGGGWRHLWHHARLETIRL